jgi:hypothetical protein
VLPDGKWLGLTSFFLTMTLFTVTLFVFISGGNTFDPLRMYISDSGDVPGWTSLIYSSGMLLIVPLRFFFLLYILQVFSRWETSKVTRIVLLSLGVILNLGTIGMSAVNYELSGAIHIGSAFVYFFTNLFSLVIILVIELRRVDRPRILWITSAANVAAGTFFLTALILTRFAPSTPRVLSTLSEWILLAALMTWLVAHSLRVHVAVLKSRDGSSTRNAEERKP